MRNHISQLQGFRAIAILCVFFHHTLSFLLEDTSSLSILNVTVGRGGVTAFLMLSGFLLACKEAEIPKLKLKEAIKSAWAKFKKLYPLHVLMLIIAFIGRFPQTKSDWCSALLSLPLNLTLTQDIIPFVSINNSFNGPSWYISSMFIIWILIFLFPNIINRILKANKKELLKIISILLLCQLVYLCSTVHFPTQLIPINHPGMYMSWLSYFNPLLCYSQLLFGCCIARFAHLYKPDIIQQNILSLISITTLSVILLLDFDDAHTKIIVIELITCMGLLGILSEESFGSVLLNQSILISLGNVSGFLFLIHGAINYFLRSFLSEYVSIPYMFFLSLGLSLFFSYTYSFYIKHQ